ncbi:MAG: hypothetical protein ACRDTC_01795 [Pseudonocardiaceae bacterium]
MSAVEVLGIAAAGLFRAASLIGFEMIGTYPPTTRDPVELFSVVLAARMTMVEGYGTDERRGVRVLGDHTSTLETARPRRSCWASSASGPKKRQ